MEIKHIAMMVKDEEESASFYESVFGFRRVGARDGGDTFPVTAIDITDGHVMLTLIRPTADADRYREWTYETWGVNHFGIVVDDLAETSERLRAAGVEVPDEPIEFEGQMLLKFFDPNGSEIDVVDGTWRDWDTE
jgi:catechol 2,3-dioxygenase-like lactoylglutathione lyase family enzyme